MKKLLFVITTMMLAFGLTSCSFLERSGLFRDNEAIGEEYCEKIIDAIENKDADKLKSMFSTNALTEAENIDGGIEYVMDFYQGEFISKEGNVHTSETINHGEKTIRLNGIYRVTTEEHEYFVFFVYQYMDTENPDNVGLFMLQIMKQSEKEEQFDWYGKPYIAGIWLPAEGE